MFWWHLFIFRWVQKLTFWVRCASDLFTVSVPPPTTHTLFWGISTWMEPPSPTLWVVPTNIYATYLLYKKKTKTKSPDTSFPPSFLLSAENHFLITIHIVCEGCPFYKQIDGWKSLIFRVEQWRSDSCVVCTKTVSFVAEASNTSCSSIWMCCHFVNMTLCLVCECQ